MFGNNIIKLDEVDSTNKYALRLIDSEKVPEGTVVIARKQNEGRGTDQRQWESEAGMNLTFSVLLYPKFLSAESQFYLNKVFSLGLIDFLKEQSLEQLHIKWPNDVYIGKDKVSGILIQNAVQGFTFRYCIVGIGLNLNQEEFRGEAPNPVSLKMITGKDYDPDAILKSLLEHLEYRYNQLADGANEVIDRDYLEYLWRYKTMAKYKMKDEIFDAMIIGVDKYGHLLLEVPSVRIIECAFKEVEFLPD